MANKHEGSTFDSFLAERGMLEDLQTQAIKEVLAWQLTREMADRKLTQTAMARLMHTSRSQVRRILDPNDTTVTLDTLQRAASVIGRRVQLALV